MKNLLTVLIFLCLISPLFSAVFHFEDTAGKKYRIKTLVKQDVYHNGIFVRSMDMMNKATLEALYTTNMTIQDKDQKIEGPFGNYTGKYYFYQKNASMNESFHLENIYDSQFFRNPQGQMLVSPQILMPSLRSIPIFSTNNMKPGDSWQAMGEEIHEGILVKENILHFNVAVYYKYIGEEEIGGKTFSEISIDYHVMHYPKQDPDIFSFTGFSHSLYYWDQSNSIPVYYNEDYSFMFTLRNGETVLYTGTTESQEEIIADITNQQKQAIITEISNTIRNMSVRDTADGIIVNLGNILFDLNQSAIKTEFEKKLDQMSDILRKYPQIDLAVSGHTDNSGSEKFNQSLSEDRAKSVADSLIKRGISPSRISYIGSGSKTPLTDNSSEEKRSINRRVEIKLITKE